MSTAETTTDLGNLYVVAAPSGAGKTSLIKRLLTILPGVEVSVSHTTRSPRPGEREGIDYFFVDPACFQDLVARDVFLEHARVFDNHYGTSRDKVLERLRAGVDVLLEIDWQGARQVRARLPRTRSVFILPPSRDTLLRRLRARGQDSEAVIARRMARAVAEMTHYDEFDYLIINDDFDAAVDALRAILVANRQARPAQTLRHRELLRDLLA